MKVSNFRVNTYYLRLLKAVALGAALHIIGWLIATETQCHADGLIVVNRDSEADYFSYSGTLLHAYQTGMPIGAYSAYSSSADTNGNVFLAGYAALCVRQAFELFATGRHTLDSLLEILTDAGFTAPGRTKPIARETLGRMLRDRCYIGKLNYKGIEYQGRHEPLITEVLFDRVQRLLDSHAGSGTRERQHPHYLKGVVWCDRCKHRFTIMPGRGNGGTYFYFLCRGRQQKRCDHPYVAVDVMERAVEQHYARVVILPEELRTEVRAGVESAITEHFELSDELRQRFTTQLEKLDRKESYFLDLAAEEGWQGQAAYQAHGHTPGTATDRPAA